MKYDVCVLGDCSMDHIFYQNPNGAYAQEANILVPGGKGSNQAVAAARAGASVTIITRIGNDSFKNDIYNNLIANNIDTSNVEIIDGLTNNFANIYINGNDKSYKLVQYGNAIDSFTPDVITKYQNVILNSKIIVCQLKWPIEVTEALIEFCYQHQKTLVLTPCSPKKLIGRLHLLEKVSYITCNEEECKRIFNTEDVNSCIKKYPNKLIVTLCERGVIYYNGQEIVKIPAIDVHVVDTTGAGDTLNGNLTACLSQGWALDEALERAIYASAMKIQVKSAQIGMPTKDDLTKFILSKPNKKA